MKHARKIAQVWRWAKWQTEQRVIPVLPFQAEPWHQPVNFAFQPHSLCAQDPLFHQWTPNGVAVTEETLLHHLQSYGDRSYESKWKIDITEVILLLAPNYSDSANDPSNRWLLIISCNKHEKVDSAGLFCIQTYLMFHLSIFLVKLEVDFQEFLRDFSNTNSTEMNGIFSPSCFPLSSLSLRYYFHSFCT